MMRQSCFIRVNGGFGNQLFQYAFARHLALAHGIDVVLDVSAYYDKNHVSKAHHRLYLDRLGLPIEFARLPAWRYEMARKLHDFPGALQRALTGLEFRKERNQPSRTEAAAWAGIVVNGAWQSELHFAKSSATICDELRRGIGAIELQREANNTISFHVRRGDYLSVGYMATIDYVRLLEAARNHFSSHASGPWRFLVFSDDSEWCRAMLPGDDVEIQTGGSMLDDFRAIANCGHHVIANSTFSWWAAYLNPEPDKIVCAPARWMADRSAQDIGILPPGWVELDDT